MTMSAGALFFVPPISRLVVGMPSWPYSRGWGYYPSGGIGLVVLIVVVLMLMGRISPGSILRRMPLPRRFHAACFAVAAGLVLSGCDSLGPSRWRATPD